MCHIMLHPWHLMELAVWMSINGYYPIILMIVTSNTEGGDEESLFLLVIFQLQPE